MILMVLFSATNGPKGREVAEQIKGKHYVNEIALLDAIKKQGYKEEVYRYSLPQFMYEFNHDHFLSQAKYLSFVNVL